MKIKPNNCIERLIKMKNTDREIYSFTINIVYGGGILFGILISLFIILF